MLLVSCGGGGVSAPQLASVTVALSAPTAQVGQVVTATAAGLDQKGAAFALGPVTWSAQPASVASVSTSGAVTALAPGQAIITANSGGKSGSATLAVADPLAGCRLPAQFPSIGLGFPRVANRLRSTGDVHMTAIFVDFSDAPATRTPQDVFAILSPGAEQYYKAVSYAKMNLSITPNLKWLRMSKPSTGYGWNQLTFALHKAYIQEALNLAQPAVDFSTSDTFLVVANPDATALANGPAFSANSGDGVTASGKTFENGATSGHDLLVWNSFWLNHEFGHTMGLVDLYAFSNVPSPQFGYVGDFSIMGNINGQAREYLGWERWVLGWMGDDQVTCAASGQTTATLTPLEATGGAKIVVVPVGPTSAVVVESRHAAGYDSTLPKPGLLVYFIDTSIDTGHGVVKVVPVDTSDSHKLTAPLAVGQSVTYSGATVSFTAQDAAGDHLQVTRP